MITIYTKDNCSYCAAAKNLLNEKQIPFVEKKMDRDISRQQLLEMYPWGKTMPMIFDNQNFIGGYANLPKYLEENYKLLLEG